MGDVPVEAIRESQRYEMKLNRRKLKEEESDLRRSIDDLQIADLDLPDLVKRLKNKAEVDVNDLRILKNVLTYNQTNIELVLSTEGALKGLVREISGLEVKRQTEAAGCLCNLALADQRGCLTIIRVAGAYIIAALDSQNIDIAMTCAWTLGNLAGSGVQACRALCAAGGVAALCRPLRARRDPRAHAARDALTLYAHTMGDQLSEKELEQIVCACAQSAHVRSYRLEFILSCHAHFRDPRDQLRDQLLHHLPPMMKDHHTSCVGESCCELEFAVRVLANLQLDADNLQLDAAACRLLAQPGARDHLLLLVKDPRLKTSMLWLLGNMSKSHDMSHGKSHDLAEGGDLQGFGDDRLQIADVD